ncbi:unnamed protein product [Owenia fusiformis]|uniref:Uncharacterized protein n=1 Tax=Owenia fusiformis TaxID=6347 RepID=A0A8J1TMJ5_OWEFU|nr:unnamed protein product [Owenia fusiformis]
MAIKKVQKAWRRLRMIFSKKRTNIMEIGTDLSIPEHYENENEFSFVVANRLSEAVAERDTLREEKDHIETELEVERQMSDRAQNEIDELKEEIARLRGLVESTLKIADLSLEYFQNKSL